MGCRDWPEPLTPEEQREVTRARNQYEEERKTRIKQYEEEMRKMIDRGAVMTPLQLATVVYEEHLPNKEEMIQAARNLVFSDEYRADLMMYVRPVSN